MIRLFETLAAHHPTAETVTVVLDNARDNRSRELKRRHEPEADLASLITDRFHLIGTTEIGILSA